MCWLAQEVFGSNVQFVHAGDLHPGHATGLPFVSTVRFVSTLAEHFPARGFLLQAEPYRFLTAARTGSSGKFLDVHYRCWPRFSV